MSQNFIKIILNVIGKLNATRKFIKITILYKTKTSFVLKVKFYLAAEEGLAQLQELMNIPDRRIYNNIVILDKII